MKALAKIAQYLMGIIFLVMGINGFIHFMPMPEKGPEAVAYFEALNHTGYFWPFEKACEIFFGLLLLLNRWVVLAVEGFVPIIANIMLFHIFLDWPGMPLGATVFVCEAILIIYYWNSHIVQHFKAMNRAVSA